jgi:hypothetical protein
MDSDGNTHTHCKYKKYFSYEKLKYYLIKMKIFMSFLYRKVLLTKDNLAKGNGKVVKNVVFVIKMKQFNIFLYLVR